MQKSRYTQEQIAFALKHAELGMPVLMVCRTLEISNATFCI
ncbi:transposase [Sodalis sp. RH24]